jgi:hypothetical protein
MLKRVLSLITSSKRREKTSTLAIHAKAFMIQKNFKSSRKELGVNWCISTENLSRIAGRRVSHGNLRPQMKKSLKTTISSASGEGVSSSKGGRPSPIWKNPALSYSLIISAVIFDLPNTKAGG